MPFVVSRGTNVGFSVEFYTSSGALTMPTSGWLTITYPALAGGTATQTVTLTRGRVFTGTWDSTVSDLGIATVSISGAGQATPTTTQLKVVYP